MREKKKLEKDLRKASTAVEELKTANSAIQELKAANHAIQESAVVLRFPDRAEPSIPELACDIIQKMGNERAVMVAREILRQLGA